ncbi:MAG: ATP-binding protein [Myxococcota bacterium]
MATPSTRLDIRGRLFLVSIALIVVFGGISGVTLEARLRDRLQTDLEETLKHLAAVGAAGVPNDPDQIDRYADSLGERAAARVSIIRRDGVVTGDSQLPSDDLSVLDNHLQRPEVADALGGAPVGVATRYSRTLDIDMLYVAVPYPGDGPTRGVVRLAVPLSDVRAGVARLRLMVFLAGLAGLGVAGMMSGLASHWVSADLREVLDQAHRIAHQGGSRRLSLSSPQNELSGLVGSFNQMAEELEMTLAALAVERDRFGAVLEGMNDAVVVLNAKRQITLLNPAAIQLFRPSRPPLGRPLMTFIRAAAVHELVTRALTGEDGTTEFELDTESTRYVQVSATSQQRGRGCVLVCRDVTALRRLERMRSDFIANVSHELRTPVTIIRANAETLVAGAWEDTQHAPMFINGIHRNAERLSRLIEGLLNLSRLEAGRALLEPETLRLQAVAEQVYFGLRSKATQREQTIVVTVPRRLLVIADPQALEQILTNLVDNAIKYCPPGSRIEISAEMAGEDEMVRCAVSDDGPGISEHHQARIFERFYRVDHGRSKKMGGTGLGLSIVKHLIEAMEGQIGVSSEPPDGTTFWFNLPQGRVLDLAEDSVIEDSVIKDSVIEDSVIEE